MEKHVEVSILIFSIIIIIICFIIWAFVTCFKYWHSYFFPDKDVCNSVDHGCEHVCVNTDNSYICQCYEGFVLREDEKTCKSKLLIYCNFLTQESLRKHVVLEIGLFICDFT